MTPWRLIDTPPARGPFNMAMDAALMDSVRVGAPPVLRFYRWSPACLSLGRNQPAAGHYDEAALRARGIDVVRRPTGGRAVLHDRELTYSVVIPHRALGPPRSAYATINAALVSGLRQLGVDASLQPASARLATVPSIAPCFRDPAEGEVVAGGRKLVGSAQVRQGGVMLQHGSLLFEDDQSMVAELLREPQRSTPDELPATLSAFLDPLPNWSVLVAALVAGWRAVVGADLSETDPTPSEIRSAERLSADYARVAWTWHK